MAAKPDNVTEILLEVFAGTTLARNKNGEGCFIKHPTLVSEHAVEKEYESNLAKAKINKLHTNEELIKIAIKQGNWSEDKDASLKALEFSINSLKKLKNKNARTLSLNDIDLSIAEKEKEYNSLCAVKESLLSSSAENYANKKSFNYKIYAYFFKDKECTQRMFTWDEYCELERSDVIDYYMILCEGLSKFNEDNLKWCAFSNDFLNSFTIFEKAQYKIFDKSPLDLTYYQKEVISYARRIMGVINSGHHIPKECYADPDLLINFNPEEYEKTKAHNDKTAKMIDRLKEKGEIKVKEELTK